MSEREQFGQHLKVRQTTACEGPVGSTALAMLCLPVSTPTPPPPRPHTHTHTHTQTLHSFMSAGASSASREPAAKS